MDDKISGVEPKVAAPATEQAVKDAGAAAATEARLKETEALLATAQANEKKAKEEREHYKQGLLRAKQKKSAKPVDLNDPLATEEHLTNLVEDKILEKKAEEESRSDHDELERLRARNAEMERVIKATSSSNLGGGGGSGSAPVNDPKPKDPSAYWSEEDKASLRARGLTEQEIAIAEDRAKRKDYFSEQTNFLAKAH